MSAETNNMRAAVIVTLSFAIFSLSDALIKLLSQSLSVAQVTVMVTGFATVLVAGQGVVTGRVGDLVPRYPVLAFSRAVLLAVDSLLIYYAFAHLPLAEVYVLVFLCPIVVAVLAFVFLKERLSITAMLGVLLGFAGVLVTLRPGVTPIGLGHLAALGSVLLFAISVLLLRRAKAGESDMALVSTMLVVLTGMALVMVVTGEGFRPVSAANLAIAGLIGLCLFVAHTLLVRAFRLGAASIVAPFQYSQIVWGSALGFVLFGDPLELHTILGACVIIFSGWLVLK